MLDINSLTKQDAQILKTILKKDKNSVTKNEREILASRKDYMTPSQIKVFFGKKETAKQTTDNMSKQ